MLDSLLSLLNHEGSLSFGEACVYAVIGFAIIFLGIAIIIFIIWLIGFVLKKTNNLEILSKVGKKNKSKSEVAAEFTETVSNSDEVPDEIKAAIIAALMAYYTVEAPKCEFKVKRIKRL